MARRVTSNQRSSCQVGDYLKLLAKGHRDQTVSPTATKKKTKKKSKTTLRRRKILIGDGGQQPDFGVIPISVRAFKWLDVQKKDGAPVDMFQTDPDLTSQNPPDRLNQLWNTSGLTTGLRFQNTSVSLSGSGTHQPRLMGVEKRSSAERVREPTQGLVQH